MKVKRHNKILEIIENYNIETQEELIAKLKLAGFDVTQATVSRDIRELKLLKQMSDMGTYKYVVPKNNGTENQHVYSRALASSVYTVVVALVLMLPYRAFLKLLGRRNRTSFMNEGEQA